MLTRREFIKLTAVLAAGTAVTMSLAGNVPALADTTLPSASRRPLLHHVGHARSGCSFRPELSDMWAGGGAELPENL